MSVNVENRKNETIVNKLYRLLWLFFMLYLIERPMLDNKTLNLLIWVIPVGFIIFFVCFNIGRVNFVDLALLGLVVFIILFGMLFYGVAMKRTVISAIICFVTNYFFLSLSSCEKINKQTFDFIFYCNIALAILFFVYSFTPIAHIAYNINTSKKFYCEYFTYNLDNPNYAGMILFSFFCNITIGLKSRKSKILRLFCFVVLAMLLWMIYETNSRSCFVSAIVLMFFYVVYNLRESFKAKKIKPLIICLICLTPVVFVWLYLLLYSNGLQDVQILGKSLFSGREETYKEYLGYIDTPLAFLFGNMGKTVFNNAHNGPLAIFTTIGLFGSIIIYILYFRFIFRINNGTNNSSSCIICILCVFIQSSFEAAFMLGGFAAMITLNSLFFLSSLEEENNNLNVC